MIKVLIIDDEPLARSIVKEYLHDYAQIEVLEECRDGFEGVKAVMQHQPDLIFLDIQMPKINGFEMLELIERPPAVIFTTAFDEYAIRAFEAHAADYLLKPYSKERFDKALQKWLSQQTGSTGAVFSPALLETAARTPLQQNRVVVKSNGKIKIIPVHDIQYFEAADDYVKIHTASGTHLKNKTMQYFEQLLDARQFVRTHRSYIVNIQQVTRLDPYEKENYVAVLHSGLKVPVSKTGYLKLKMVLGL
ncbi:LytTR family transcriptional regulator DNA-binding domain-containing protein [Agriterribacter sp.]|uniref:LytR/AlgR family response regulator transcription factor n=1 Tax=Agriterribacter sp. TaxID=2821509 RepID=UPI002D089284|nr:LytTR family transcriptional regulator DNA-binding domain-containing protein [Agriterribacter sp.]HRP55511.1 LytTR family transcriptional regulator DNA-binding domain-containing protein [Agriterribacter sp.]